MDAFLRDVRHAIRNLLRTPGFAIVTILTLALGIGANTAIFSVVNAVILRPLGYPQPDRLVFISSQFPKMGFDQFWVSPPEFLELQERARSFSGDRRVRDRPGEPDRGRSSAAREHRPPCRPELFKVLGVNPMLGRGFDAAETLPNGAQVAMLSYETWQSAFGGQRGHRRLAGRDQRRPADGRRHDAAAFRRRRQPRRSVAAARHRPGQPAESRQSLSVPDRAARAWRDAGEREGPSSRRCSRPGRRRLPGRPAPTSGRTRRTPRTTGCASTRCRCRSSAARGPRCSSCRAPWCSCC